LHEKTEMKEANMNVEETSDSMGTVPADQLRFIERAQKDEFKDGGIARYYERALANGVHDAVLAAIELRMRTDFPRIARQVFGARGAQAEEMLERVREALAAQFDVSANGLGNHIKVGGDERRTGSAYVYRYLSYRATGQQFGAQISLIQASPAAELRVKVRYYRVYAGSANIDEQQWFAAADLDQAVQAYVALLDKLRVPRRALAA
jgi:hypothetical protein